MAIALHHSVIAAGRKHLTEEDEQTGKDDAAGHNNANHLHLSNCLSIIIIPTRWTFTHQKSLLVRQRVVLPSHAAATVVNTDLPLSLIGKLEGESAVKKGKVLCSWV